MVGASSSSRSTSPAWILQPGPTHRSSGSHISHRSNCRVLDYAATTGAHGALTGYAAPVRLCRFVESPAQELCEWLDDLADSLHTTSTEVNGADEGLRPMMELHQWPRVWSFLGLKMPAMGALPYPNGGIEMSKYSEGAYSSRACAFLIFFN